LPLLLVAGAMFQHFLDLVDPDGVLPEHERVKRAENARREHLSRITLKASKVRKMRAAADQLEQEVEQVERELITAAGGGAA
jgi:hypothetical protein